MHPPRVILFSSTQGAGSGAERVLEHLIGSRHPGIGLVIAPPGSSVAAAAMDIGCPTLPWETSSNSTAGNARARVRFSSRRAREFDCQLFHAWHTRGFEWGVSLARSLGLPLVGTLHDDPTSRVNSATRRFLLRASAHQMRSLAVVSQATGDLCASAGWTVPTTVIRNGLPDEVAPREEPSRPAIRVGFLGLNEPWKGLATVAHLVESLQHLPVEWKLFGSPSPAIEPALQELLRRFPERVRFLDRRPTREIYGQIDVVLHPSVAFDPYPTVLLEAARAGLPVVASAIGGAPEIVTDGETGFLYPPADQSAARTALESLVRDPVLRCRLGHAARARYEAHFQVAKMAAAYENLWSHLP